MSQSKLYRVQLLQHIDKRQLAPRAAVQSLGISYHQVKRLVASYRQHGSAGLVSGKRGTRSNRRLPTALTDHVVCAAARSDAGTDP